MFLRRCTGSHTHTSLIFKLVPARSLRSGSNAPGCPEVHIKAEEVGLGCDAPKPWSGVFTAAPPRHRTLLKPVRKPTFIPCKSE